MQAKLLTFALILTGATGAVAEEMKMPVNASQLKWAPAPDALPKGAKWVVLSGDPSKDGLYVVRLKLPAGYKVAAHNHPTNEMLTVIVRNYLRQSVGRPTKQVASVQAIKPRHMRLCWKGRAACSRPETVAQ